MKKIFYSIAVFLLTLAACTRTEYQRPEEGEPIPYRDSLQLTIQLYIQQSGNSLFKQMWLKGDLDSYLKDINELVSDYTLLMPSDQALLDEGWNSNAINIATKEDIRSFILPHIARSQVHLATLEQKGSSFLLESLYRYPNHFIQYRFDKVKEQQHPYYYRFVLQQKEGGLFVNGKRIGKDAIYCKNGILLPVSNTIIPNRRSIWQFLKEESEYSLFTSLLEATDSIYLARFKEANGYFPKEGPLAARVYHRDSKQRYALAVDSSFNGRIVLHDLNTFFIPTNSAFEQAGFRTLQDLLTYNESRGLPHRNWVQDPDQGTGFYALEGEFATDSLMDYHQHWGLRFQKDTGYILSNELLFFTTDLQFVYGNNYPIAKADKPIYWPGTDRIIRSETYIYNMPFIIQNNQNLVIPSKVKTTIIRDNHFALNGIIHTVNKLMIPEGF